MRITSWIRAEIVEWLGLGPNRLDIKEDGSITFTYPHPSVIERRKQLVAFAKSQWAVGIGCTLLGVILGKLL
jgi:hypothetical protein